MIPSTYFNPQLRRAYTLHRGFNPETNEITFAPLHDVQDEAFGAACEQSAQHPHLYHDWGEVEVEAASVSTFLEGAGEAVADSPKAAYKVPSLGSAKSNRIVAAIIKNWGQGHLPPNTLMVKERNAIIRSSIGDEVGQNTIHSVIYRLKSFGFK